MQAFIFIYIPMIIAFSGIYRDPSAVRKAIRKDKMIEMIPPNRLHAQLDSLALDSIAKFSAAVCNVPVNEGCMGIYESGKYNCGPLCQTNSELKKIIINERTNSQAVITTHSSTKTLVIAFKGTKLMSEWIKNMKMHMTEIRWTVETKDDNRKMHHGFQDIYIGLRQEILDFGIDFMTTNPDYKILFTGWSLGAALALIGAVDFYERSGMAERIYTITFGQPRVGNDHYANYVNSLPIIAKYNLMI
jgi:hypothetical protein